MSDGEARRLLRRWMDCPARRTDDKTLISDTEAFLAVSPSELDQLKRRLAGALALLQQVHEEYSNPNHRGKCEDDFPDMLRRSIGVFLGASETEGCALLTPLGPSEVGDSETGEGG